MTVAMLAGMPKPTVAAVHGYALGAGFQLALACDLRAAATDACFGMLEARYGLIPDMGGAHRLARLVGPGRAKEMVWSTRRVEAKEAERRLKGWSRAKKMALIRDDWERISEFARSKGGPSTSSGQTGIGSPCSST